MRMKLLALAPAVATLSAASATPVSPEILNYSDASSIRMEILKSMHGKAGAAESRRLLSGIEEPSTTNSEGSPASQTPRADGVHKPSFWPMWLVGFAGLAYAARPRRTKPRLNNMTA